MRLLIAKLASAPLQSVSVALGADTDVADLATDLENCVQLVRDGGYDIVLLITGQGGASARGAVERLRRESGHVPLIVLTEPAVGAIPALAAAMGSGARSRTPSLPGSTPFDEQAAPAGDYTGWGWPDRGPLGIGVPPVRRPALSLGADGETLHAGSRSISLSQAEARIFARLWEGRGRIVSAEELMSSIYGEGDRPASRVLPVFLFKLRKKLAGLGLDDLIETAIGRGFMIREDVSADISVEHNA